MTRRSGVLAAMAALARRSALSAAPSSRVRRLRRQQMGSRHLQSLQLQLRQLRIGASSPSSPAARPSGSPTSPSTPTALGLPEGSVKDVRVDLPTGPQRQPRGDQRPVHRGDRSRAAPARAPPKSGRSKRPRSTCSAWSRSRSPRPSTTSCPNRASRPSSASASTSRCCSTSRSSSKAASTGRATTTRASRSAKSPTRCRSRATGSSSKGTAGNGSFITVGSNCSGSTTTGLTVDSHENPGELPPLRHDADRPGRPEGSTRPAAAKSPSTRASRSPRAPTRPTRRPVRR